MVAGFASKESGVMGTTAGGSRAAVASKDGLPVMTSRSALTAAEMGSSAGPGKAAAVCR